MSQREVVSADLLFAAIIAVEGGGFCTARRTFNRSRLCTQAIHLLLGVTVRPTIASLALDCSVILFRQSQRSVLRQVTLSPEPIFHRGFQFREGNPPPDLEGTSPVGRVSSKMESLVKFRIEKLS